MNEFDRFMEFYGKILDEKQKSVLKLYVDNFPNLKIESIKTNSKFGSTMADFSYQYEGCEGTLKLYFD